MRGKSVEGQSSTLPNPALEPTPYSLRSAAASGRCSPRTFGARRKEVSLFVLAGHQDGEVGGWRHVGLDTSGEENAHAARRKSHAL
jgi:hypothetical protein